MMDPQKVIVPELHIVRDPVLVGALGGNTYTTYLEVPI